MELQACRAWAQVRLDLQRCRGRCCGMAYHCRALTPDDANAWLAALIEGVCAFPLGFMTSEMEARAMTASRARDVLGHGAFRGVFDGARLVGFCAYRREVRERIRHRAHLGPFYVSQDHQGTGCAQALMEAVIAEARASDVAQLELGVDTRNARAIAFYERVGFERFGLHPDEIRIDGQSHDGFLYRLRL